MKKGLICGFGFITCLILLITVQSFTAVTPAPNIQVSSIYTNNFEVFKKETKKLTNLVTNPKTTINIQQLKSQYYLVRTAYKQIECFWEYIDPVYVKEWVNGAPLPKLDKASPQLLIIEPKGLQVIDELLFEDSVDVKELQKIIVQLNDAIEQYPIPQKLSDRVIFESMRIELIRLFNLGLTGFDVPSSNRSIADALVVLQTMHTSIQPYFNTDHSSNVQHQKSMEYAFNLGFKQLQQQQDFDAFDRLSFLVQVVNPLFKGLLHIQQGLGIETIYEVLPSSSKLALNYNAQNLFDNDFLNPFYYVNIPQKLYSPQLVQLGSYLFYDPILSASNDRSCASCHNPQKGFTDGLEKSLATGMSGNVDRNSPTLLNAVFSERFFHDLRAEALEDQMEHVVSSNKEFNTNTFTIIGKLNQSSAYQKLFSSVFTEYANPISQQTIAFAISAYVSSLHGFNSKFDQFIRGEQLNLAPEVKRGFNLFMGKAACGTCHFAPVFNGTVPPQYTESESEVLGVLKHPSQKPYTIDSDLGRYGVRLKESADFYKRSFKTPTIRNIALTAPYMHNGAYRTLGEVMDFYNAGGGIGIGLDVPYQTLPPDSLGLTQNEIDDIISFMHSLTDTTLLTNVPSSLPLVEGDPVLNARKVGGNY